MKTEGPPQRSLRKKRLLQDTLPGNSLFAAFLANLLLLAGGAAFAAQPSLRIVGVTNVVGRDVTDAIQLVAVGNENALSFSVSFDPTLLLYRGETLGSGALGAALNVNSNQASSGRIGYLLARPGGQAFAAGVNELLVVRFQLGNTPTNTMVGFTNTPVSLETVDVSANTIATSYSNASVVITPLFTPGIVTLSSDQTVAVGANVTMSVIVTGSPPLFYQWQFNGTPIVNGTNSSLLLTNVATNQAGLYRVSVTNEGGGITSGPVSLSILLPPASQISPQNWTASAGESVLFQATAIGSEPLRYQWRFGSTDLASETNRILILTNVTTARTGTYSVRVSNAVGTNTSAGATLAISSTPRIVRFVNRSIATSLEFDVPIELVALGDENAVGFSFQFDPSLLGFQTASLGSGANGATLLINTNEAILGRIGLALVRAAGDRFSAGVAQLLQVRLRAADLPAQATLLFTNRPIQTELADIWGNSRPVAFSNGVVNILSTPPVIIANPASATNLIFSTATFAVSASGSAPLSFQWQFNGAALAGQTNPVLLLPGVRPAQSGDYRVIVSNPVASITSSVARLTVPRVVRVVSTNGPTGTMLDVSVQVLANGDEAALGFSLSFDPNRLSFHGIVTNSWPASATLNVNSNLAASGALGFAIAQYGQPLTSGTQQIASVRFALGSVAGDVPLAFSDAPIARELVDNSTQPLLAAFQGANVRAESVPPAIVQQPARQDVLQGTRVSFTVAISGSLPVAYQWKFNGANLPNGTNATYVITSADVINNGNYTVTVSNLAGVAISSNALLTVTLPDTNGPTLTFPLYGVFPLGDGMVISNSDTFRVSATDPSGVNRVEFYVDDTLIANDNNGTDGFSAFWNVDSLPDGVHRITFKAYDGRNNLTVLSNSVNLALAPPLPPVITSPANGTLINHAWVVVQGTANRYAERVRLYINGVATTKTSGIEYNGAFSMTADLAEGTNRLSVAAVNRAGPGLPSGEVRVIVDTSIPGAPTGVDAISQAGGLVRLSWWGPSGVQIKGYHIFRSTTPFATAAEAVRVTDAPVNATVYTDLPSQDGTFYYRVLTVNYVDTESPLSGQVNAVSDRTAPRAMVDFSTTGAHLGDRYATGTVSVTLTVTEKLLSVPFLSLVRTNGAPISIALTPVSDTNYTGSFTISPGMGTGQAYINFSGRDLVGNRGTEVDSGAVIVIDTDGPDVTGLSLTPSEPIRNSSTNPISVFVTLAFSEEDFPAGTPLLSYALSVTQPASTALTLTPLTNHMWQGSLSLPSTAGVTNELLSFSYRGADNLGNISTVIAGKSAFEIYQGALPAFAPPEGLSARALTGGVVELAWRAVAGASDYAVFRQGPGEPSLSIQTNTFALVYRDVPAEGTNRYAVASLRHANSQTSTSALSTIVSVVSDRTAPGSPTGVRLAPQGSGIAVFWSRPTGTEPITYVLYRDTSPISVTTGLPPLKTNILSTNALDPNPRAGPSYYSVTAVDAVGNESLPSISAYTNISLLPISSLQVEQRDGELPLVSWAHADPGHISGYNLYVGAPGQELRINGALLPTTATNFTDTGYDRHDRRYAIAAVDTGSGAQVESPRRSILLPVVTVTPQEGVTIKRGVMNRLGFTVRNDSAVDVSNVTLRVEVLGRSHLSEQFAVLASSSTITNVAVGGYPDLPDTVWLTNAIIIVPDLGEQVTVTATTNVAVGDDLLVLDILNEEFARGAIGRARFVLHNTSSEEIEIVTATRTGSAASPDTRLKLTDLDGNVFSVVPIQQLLGKELITLADGTTVARIAPGESFTSALTDIAVPVAATSEVKLQVEIDRIHYHLGRENHVVMSGLTSTRRIALSETPYYATVTNISPVIAYSATNIHLAGQVLERGSGRALGRVPVALIVSLRGFERAFTLYSDEIGNWSYEFTPGETEAGTYSVYALHPSVVARPDQGQFEVRRLFISPTRGTLRCPRNFAQNITLRVTASSGMVISNLNVAYEALDQFGGAFTPGISVITNAPISILGAGQSTSLNCVVLGASNAPSSGSIVLRVRSDTPLPGVWGFVTVDYTFVGEAAPSLQWTPNFIETGVTASNSVSEQITLSNVGLADMLGVRVAVVTTNGEPAPDWVFLSSAGDLGALAVGSNKLVSLSFSPDTTVPISGTTPYLFYVRITAENHPTRDIPIYVNVDRSGIGNALFKVMDIYTGTLDNTGNPIQGLAGARIRLVKEEGTAIETNLVTDAVGEAIAEGLPAGRYSVRLSASGHNDRSDTLWIRPGITISSEYTLESQLVTVEWNVRETTIQDHYEIVLNATYQTDVPAPVVVIDPPSLSLPEMASGDVLNGEFTIRNYGLIRAEDVNLTLPASDQFFKYETLGSLPTALEAKQVMTVPYRVTCLSSFDGDQQSGGGGACRTYATCASICYRYRCSNGATFSSCASFCFFRLAGACGTGTGGTGGASGPVTWTGPGGSSAGGGGTGTPTSRPQSLGGVICWPEAVWKEIWFDADITPLLETLQNILFAVGCSVNCVNRTFMDDSTDLSVKVPGGRLEVKRLFTGTGWAFEDDRRLQGTAEVLAQLPRTLSRCYNGRDICLAYAALPNIAAALSFPHAWDVSPPTRLIQQFTHETYTLSLYQAASDYYWWLEDKRGKWEHYQADGRLARRGDKRGITAIYSHEFDGGTAVTRVYDQGHNLAFTYEYNGAGQITAAYDRTGRRVQYHYAGDRLTEVLDAHGQSTLYEYDGTGRMTRKVDAGGRPTLVTYDSQGNVSSAIDRNGNGHFFTFNYDANKQSRYAQIRSSSGMVKEVWYDDEGETRRVDINGRTIQSIAKDGRNLIITDEKGNVTRKERDAWDNVTRIVYPDNSSVSLSFEYRFNQPTRFVGQNGVTYLFDYDDRGNLTRKVDAAGTPAERITLYAYDSSGQLTNSITLADADSEACTNQFGYDERGNLSYVVDPMGATTRFLAHDAIGNPFAIQDANSNVWHFGYDPLGRLISATDPTTNLTMFAYDGANNRTNVVNALLKSFGFEHDDHNNVIKVLNPLMQALRYQYNSDNLPTRRTDLNGNELALTYDNEGRVTRGVDGATNQIMYRYDDTRATPASSYLPVSIGYPSFTRNLFYNTMQRLVSEEHAASGRTNQAHTYTYDPAGNILIATDAEGNTNRFEYDELNRLIKSTDAAGGVTRQTFDNRDNVIAVEDANGGVTRYQYDRNNRITKITRPMGQEILCGYDPVGNCSFIIDAKGQKIANEYDSLHRVTRKLHFAATDYANPLKTVTFSYNALGSLTAWGDGTYSAAFTYDDLQRKTSESVFYGAFTLSYSNTYYANGLKKSFTGPDGQAYEYSYDDNNRPAALSIPGVGRVTWESYSWNSPTRITLPGGATTDIHYDSLMRTESITARGPTNDTVVSRNYQYSPAGNVLSKVTEHGAYTFGYDKRYRLTSATNAALPNETYSYDLLGNRTNSAVVTDLWSYNLNNELLSYTNMQFAYDINGNTIRKSSGSQTTIYFYDVADHLVRVESGEGALIAQYGYDPFGRRLWKEVHGTRTCFFYSDEGLVGEYTVDGTEIKTYGYAPGSPWSSSPIFQKAGGNHYWYHDDNLGTPQKIVDSNGHVRWAGIYDSYGNCQTVVADIVNNLRFAGQYYDEETRIHYNCNRYYDPTAGRYMSADPFRDDINLYLYCQNNPAVLIDPLGLCNITKTGRRSDEEFRNEFWIEGLGTPNQKTYYYDENGVPHLVENRDYRGSARPWKPGENVVQGPFGFWGGGGWGGAEITNPGGIGPANVGTTSPFDANHKEHDIGWWISKNYAPDTIVNVSYGDGTYGAYRSVDTTSNLNLVNARVVISDLSVVATYGAALSTVLVVHDVSVGKQTYNLRKESLRLEAGR